MHSSCTKSVTEFSVWKFFVSIIFYADVTLYFSMIYLKSPVGRGIRGNTSPGPVRLWKNPVERLPEKAEKSHTLQALFGARNLASGTENSKKEPARSAPCRLVWCAWNRGGKVWTAKAPLEDPAGR